MKVICHRLASWEVHDYVQRVRKNKFNFQISLKYKNILKTLKTSWVQIEKMMGLIQNKQTLQLRIQRIRNPHTPYSLRILQKSTSSIWQQTNPDNKIL